MINYYLLTKPGIIFGNLITLAAGFLLASKGTVDFFLFFQTLLGLALVMASACVFNNYIDRNADKKMERTRQRALVVGTISISCALWFASIIGLCGFLILFLFTNPLTVSVAGVGFFVYVIIYSLWKSHTIYGTAIGSVAGAVPPVVGYCAVSNQIDAGALILFAMMILWQMPHFFSIAVYRLDDYRAAGIPVLPVVRSMLKTKVHTVLYIVGFIFASALLTVFGYTGYAYLYVVMAFGLFWLGMSLAGFALGNDRLWARRMFLVSLIVICVISLMIPLDNI